MQLTFGPTRLTGFAIIAIAGAAALTVGGCHKDSPEAPPADLVSVSGLIASVSDNTVQVNQDGGTATVEVSPSAKVDEFSKAQLADITTGNCVSVALKPGAAPEDAATAITVQRTLQGDDGKCWQPKVGAAGSPVNGTVASAVDNTIDVTVTDSNGKPAVIGVTVTDTTQYSKDTATTPQAIAQGKCITARGTKDGDGTLKATVVTLGPAHDGKCPRSTG